MSKITHLFWEDFIKTYTIMHQMQSSRYLIDFHMKNLQDIHDLFRGDTSAEGK
jgi:hypothetical protein